MSVAAGGAGVDPPRPDALVPWPKDFGTRFLLVVDVEEEFDWAAPLSRENRATTALAALPNAHRRLAAAGAGLLCLIDHPIATDPSAADRLGAIVADPRSEVGAQLHSWVTPPFEETVTVRTSFQGNLPVALEAAKIDALTAAVTAATGMRPRAFRAGRYGLGRATHRLLGQRGYRLDLSPRARHSYTAEGGPDFAPIGNAAWRTAGLLVVPASTVFTGRARRAGAALTALAGRLPRGRGLLARTGLLARVPLTPEGTTPSDACAAIDAAIADGERLLVFGFHSPSLVPGHTPYVRDAGELAAFWRWWDRVLAHLAQRGVESVTVADLLAAADG